MNRFRRLLAALVLVVVPVAAAMPSSVRAGDLADARELVAEATASVERLRADPNFPKYWEEHLYRARAVLIIPDFFKAAFFVGGARGSGVMMVRDASGAFSPPSFHRMTAGSVGIQFGGQNAEIIFFIMTEKGIEAILTDQFKLGANLGVTFGPVGAGIEAATTTNAGSDIIAFSHADGVFGGAGVEGAGLEVLQSWNKAAYGLDATPRGILLDRRWPMPDFAAPLINALQVRDLGMAPAAPAAPAPASGQAPAPAAPAPNPGLTPTVPARKVERQHLQ